MPRPRSNHYYTNRFLDYGGRIRHILEFVRWLKENGYHIRKQQGESPASSRVTEEEAKRLAYQSYGIDLEGLREEFRRNGKTDALLDKAEVTTAANRQLGG